jgi:hypothetical protein
MYPYSKHVAAASTNQVQIVRQAQGETNVHTREVFKLLCRAHWA